MSLLNPNSWTAKYTVDTIMNDSQIEFRTAPHVPIFLFLQVSTAIINWIIIVNAIENATIMRYQLNPFINVIAW